MTVGRVVDRGVIYREYTECYSISFLFLFFLHQSSLYSIKIFAKCFYLLEEFLRTIGQFWTVLFSLRTKVSQTLLNVLCITINKYLVRVLVVLLHARFSVVCPIPFLLAAIFFSGYRSNATGLYTILSPH